MGQLLNNWSSAKTEAENKGLPFHLFTDGSTREDRMKICKGCENLSKALFCSICNCYMPIKVWVNTADCPKQLW